MPNQFGPGASIAEVHRETGRGIRLRVLAIAEAANPEWVSVPLIGWSLAQALGAVADVHLVTHVRNKKAIEHAGWACGRDFTAIDSEAIGRPLWKLAELLRGGSDRRWSVIAALNSISYPYFETLVWRKFRKAIRSGAYDVVHRITPVSPALPSMLSARCHSAGVPFVLGPINGGWPWPKGFEQLRREEGESLHRLRGLHQILPGYRSTRENASAILVGSRAAWNEIPKRYHHKRVYLPENAIQESQIPPRGEKRISGPLRVVFAGRLVPLKGVDLLLEAMAPLLRDGRAALEIIGDGPSRAKLEEQVKAASLKDAVRFLGWLPQLQVLERLAKGDVFGFPSIRDFGGGVVLEAMAVGTVPIIVDYGGPAELVTTKTGFKVPLASRSAMVADFRRILYAICKEPGCLTEKAELARVRSLSEFTWTAKAAHVMEVYRWVLGLRVDRPCFDMLFGER